MIFGLTVLWALCFTSVYLLGKQNTKKVSCELVEFMHHKKVRLWVGDHLVSEEKERSEL